MRKIFTILMMSVAGLCQAQDYFVTKSTMVVHCKITLVNDKNLFYTDAKGYERYVSLEEIDRFNVDSAATSKRTQENDVYFHATGITYTEDAVSFSTGQGALEYMRDNLTRYHSEYMDGICVTAGGFALAAIGVMMVSNNANAGIEQDTDLKKFGTILMTAGGIAMTVGCIVMIDSHRFVHRAGNWTFSPTSVRITF